MMKTQEIAPGSAPTKAPIFVTQSAARKIWELLSEEKNDALHLRAYVVGGGCSGFQYGFTFDETIQSDDIVIETPVSMPGAEGSVVKTLVDPMSLQYLMGAEIDYVEDVSGAQFIIRNPNASTTCGCGSSFSS